MGFLDTAPLGEQREEAIARIRKAPPGLEIARYWQVVATHTPDSARRLVSYLASALLARGWLQAADRVLEAAADTLGESADHVKADFDLLVAADLLTVEAGKITCIAGLMSIKPTGLVFKFDGQHEIHLPGPLAAIAIGKALQKAGEVRATCADDKTTKLVLKVDKAGIVERTPEEICLFLRAWNGETPPTAASSAGGLFRNDDALGRWQEQAGDPAGMPLASLLFGMAVGDLGLQVGGALESVLNHLPDFD